eukprot:GILK01004797.1.p1 GENE.GILK01004797.1~~GILK01004797.1.p1  ORF type:complete len:405 (-),score=41.43 GILK01004797.1:122-1300(-)
MEELNSFLRSARRDLQQAVSPEGHDTTVHVVIGNSAMDLDSTISSLVLAFFLTRISLNAFDIRGNNVVLPVFNIQRVDLELRIEVVYWLRFLGIDIESLVFLDEINLRQLHELQRLRVILVDHNQLDPSQEYLGDSVTMIVDHHEDKGLYNASKRVIYGPPGGAGSCCSLVAELVRPYLNQPLIAKALMGVILIDTSNFLEELKDVKWIDKDKAACEMLARVMGDVDREKQTALFQELDDVKTDLGANLRLSMYNKLRKDYKEYIMNGVRVGISSVLIPLAVWVQHDTDFLAEMNRYLNDRHLEVLLLGIVYKDPEIHRQAVIFTPNDDLRQRLATYLCSQVVPSLELQPLECALTGEPTLERQVVAFSQGNIAASRKQMEPFLQTFFQSYS